MQNFSSYLFISNNRAELIYMNCIHFTPNLFEAAEP